MTLEELFPKDTSITLNINDVLTEFYLGKFTLEKAKRLNDIFDGKLEQALTVGKAEDLAIIAWVLMKPESKKELLSHKIMDVNEETGEEIEICKEGHKKILSFMSTVNDVVNLLTAIGTCVGVSTHKPELKKKERENGNSSTVLTETHWGEIYDMFASEYGYTIQQFGSLTMKELVSFYECISVRRHNDYVSTVKIHHPKAKIKYVDLKKRVQEMNESQKDLILKATQAAKNRKSEELSGRQS